MVIKIKIEFRFFRLAVFAAILPLIFCAKIALAYEGSSGGMRIQTTPFDYKLSQAGFFKQDLNSMRYSGRESLEDLFLTARSFRYIHDKNESQWQSPKDTESKHAGDCKDKALWLYSELKKNGYWNVRLVVGKYRSFDRSFHAWLWYTDDSNITYLLDPTIQKKVWELKDMEDGFYKPAYSFNGDNKYRYAVS